MGTTVNLYICTEFCERAPGGALIQKSIAATPGGPGNFLFVLNAEYVGGFTNTLIQFLVLSSLFAGLLATHNATARYFFALSRDGLLPAALARTHATCQSPHVASAFQAIIGGVAGAVFAVSGANPLTVMGTSMGGLGVLGVVLLQAAAAFAVIGFFARRSDGHWWKTRLAPLAGGIGLIIAEILIVENYGSLVSGQHGIVTLLPWLIPGAAVLGLGYAAWLRQARPAVFGAIARDPAARPATAEVTVA